ncbi:hypothetical protein N7509_003880 [Penicillium cosmopolitanum]|uniref:C2H2-type domain-containing protein n=1 Tax=Penicillium cosmopolitanum TaxID=1131564 RepID=A0A9X0BBX0_9EURO|nr:uncharacterized protein N7509_003880 [Penicillium cosmopolitanum]KAJ5404009.1 hypothetical protein N7509_003880 [Penicillium cosmopolitanum]
MVQNLGKDSKPKDKVDIAPGAGNLVYQAQFPYVPPAVCAACGSSLNYPAPPGTINANRDFLPLQSVKTQHPLPLNTPFWSPTGSNQERALFQDHPYGPANYLQLPKKNCRYQCMICQKPFLRPIQLITHVRSHTGEKPFRCPNIGCEKMFSVSSNAKRHAGKCPTTRDAGQKTSSVT